MLVVALLLCGVSIPVSAAGASHPCASQADPQQRLACYDSAFGAPETRAQTEALTVKAKEDFGLASVEKRQRSETGLPQPSVDQIDARITAISTASGGERVLTLDNEQVWMIVERTIRGPLVEGDAVSVRKAALGTHRLVTPAGVGLRVRRLR